MYLIKTSLELLTVKGFAQGHLCLQSCMTWTVGACSMNNRFTHALYLLIVSITIALNPSQSFSLYHFKSMLKSINLKGLEVLTANFLSVIREMASGVIPSICSFTRADMAMSGIPAIY